MSLPLSLSGNNGDGQVADDDCDLDDGGVKDEEDGDDIDDKRL